MRDSQRPEKLPPLQAELPKEARDSAEFRTLMAAPDHGERGIQTRVAAKAAATTSACGTNPREQAISSPTVPREGSRTL